MFMTLCIIMCVYVVTVVTHLLMHYTEVRKLHICTCASLW